MAPRPPTWERFVRFSVDGYTAGLGTQELPEAGRLPINRPVTNGAPQAAPYLTISLSVANGITPLWRRSSRPLRNAMTVGMPRI